MLMINGIKVNHEAVLYSGGITDVNETEVTIRITARMGIIKMPLRAILGNEYPKIGDKVTWKMSLIEMENMSQYRED